MLIIEQFWQLQQFAVCEYFYISKKFCEFYHDLIMITWFRVIQ